MNRSWFVRRNGKIVGPIPSDQLKRWLAEGKIHPDDELRREDRDAWTRARPTLDRAAEPRRRTCVRPLISAACVILGAVALYVTGRHLLEPAALEKLEESVDWPDGARHQSRHEDGIGFHAFDAATQLDDVAIDGLDALDSTIAPRVLPEDGSRLFRLSAPEDHWIFAWSGYPVHGAVQGYPGLHFAPVRVEPALTPDATRHEQVIIVQSEMPSVFVATVAHPRDDATRERARAFLDAATSRGRRAFHGKALLTILRALGPEDHARHLGWVAELASAPGSELAREDTPVARTPSGLLPWHTRPAELTSDEAACTLFVLSGFARSGPLEDLLARADDRKPAYVALRTMLGARRPPPRVLQQLLLRQRGGEDHERGPRESPKRARDAVELLAALDPRGLFDELILEARGDRAETIYHLGDGWSRTVPWLLKNPELGETHLHRMVETARGSDGSSPAANQLLAAIDRLDPAAAAPLRKRNKTRRREEKRRAELGSALAAFDAEYDSQEARRQNLSDRLKSLVEATHADGVKQMLARAAQPGARTGDGFGREALRSALERNDAEIATLLVTAGTPLDIEVRIDRVVHAPLDVALSLDDGPLLDALLARDARSRVQPGGKPELLLHAALSGRHELVNRLLRAGADVNARFDRTRDTLLMRYLLEGKETAILARLINAGARVNDENNEKRTPLDFAIKASWGEGALFLFDVGADVRRSPRALITFTTELVGVEAVIAALDRGADPDVSEHGRAKQTALHKAVILSRAPYVKALLDRGANPNVRDHQGRTPLDLALDGDRAEKSPEIADLLRGAGGKKG